MLISLYRYRYTEL